MGRPVGGRRNCAQGCCRSASLTLIWAVVRIGGASARRTAEGFGMAEFSDSFYARVTRRTLLKMAGVGAVTIGAGSLIEACDLGVKGSSTGSAGKITIGYVSPQTGALAGFATGDNFV